MITQRLAPGRLPEGQRVYAVGDVHGCTEMLAALHAKIAADLAERPVLHALVVHLGDFIDRGPDSAGVIAALLRDFPADPMPSVMNLMGNHEEMMLTALATEDTGAAAHWLRNGGGASLSSWGLSWRDGAAAWAAAIPPEHLGFVRGLGLICRAGNYIFVHAGLRPGVALEAQTREDMLWIREPFLSFDGEMPGVVVHGHTPEDGPVVRRHRIGIDTGAVMGGPLSCVVLEGESLGFLQV
jgi:serine/threonine protein phosphatase 1